MFSWRKALPLLLAYAEWIIQNESSCRIIKLHKSKGRCSSQISAKKKKNHNSYSSVYLDGYFVCADVPKTIITHVSLWYL